MPYKAETITTDPVTGKKVRKKESNPKQKHNDLWYAGKAAYKKEKRLEDKAKRNKSKYDLLDENQKQLKALMDEAITQGTGPLSDVFGKFDEAEFNKGIVDPAMKNFREKILPQISEKYIAGGQAGGSGQLAAELEGANDLQSALAGLNYQARQQQKQNRIGGIQTNLGVHPYENIIKEKPAKTNWLEQGVRIGGNILTAAAGAPGVPGGDIAVEGANAIKAGGIGNR